MYSSSFLFMTRQNFIMWIYYRRKPTTVWLSTFNNGMILLQTFLYKVWCRSMFSVVLDVSRLARSYNSAQCFVQLLYISCTICNPASNLKGSIFAATPSSPVFWSPEVKQLIGVVCIGSSHVVVIFSKSCIQILFHV